MALKTKVQPLDRSIVLTLTQDLTPEARSKALASFARKELKKGQEHNKSVLGFLPTHETFVDGRKDASEDSVKPDGRILYEFYLLDGVFAWIGEQLVKHAPVLTGEFANSFLFFADDQPVPAGARLPDANRYTFASPLPYARKLERGYSDQAPHGVFEVVAKLARTRYRGQATIRFTYVSLTTSGNGVSPYASRSAIAAKARAKGASAGRANQVAKDIHKSKQASRTPAIVIELP